MIPVDEQDKLLRKAIQAIEQHKKTLSEYFSGGANIDGLHCCANLLRGMRTSNLSPKAYYELYIKATAVLNTVEEHLSEEFKQGRGIPHLYEIVQYVSSVVPRIYLLVTVGVVYIKSGELPCREILKDLVEMCRGVQHPLRGLFLRNYLLSSIRPDLLPDSLPTEDDTAPSVIDSVNFILLNFSEMNKLWVRIQHQGHTRDRERREQERRDLRVLVGGNLHRLSLLESVNADLYKTHILPGVLEQVIQCRDVIAQEYLMDVIIQTFPDEFHAATLTELLQACERFQPAVRLKPLIEGLVKRLLRYISTTSQEGINSTHGNTDNAVIPANHLFESLSSEISGLVRHRADLYNTTPSEARIGLPPEDVAGLFPPLLSMAICLSLSTDVVDQVLLSAADALENLSVARVQSGSLLSRELLNLLNIPLYGPGGVPKSTASYVESATFAIFFSGTPPSPCATADYGELSCLSNILRLSSFLRIFGLLDISARRRLACVFIAQALERDNSNKFKTQKITSEEDLDSLFSITGVLIDRPDSALTIPSTSDESGEELFLLASVIHIIGDPVTQDPDAILKLLSKARRRFVTGGPIVIKATFPTLVFKAIRLLPIIYSTSLKDVSAGVDQEEEEEEEKSTESGEVKDWEVQCERVIAFCHQSVSKLIACSAPDTALRLLLNCTLVIQSVPLAKQSFFAYDFFSQAFTLFEQELSDARSQLSAFCLMVSTLSRMRHCWDDDVDSFNVLRTQCSRAAFNLLLRSNQSRAVAISAQLHADESDDLAELLKCLQRARAQADMCMDGDARAQLYVDLLNYYISHYQQVPGSLQMMKDNLADLLTETDKIINQLDFVPDSIAQYFELTKSKINEILAT